MENTYVNEKTLIGEIVNNYHTLYKSINVRTC